MSDVDLRKLRDQFPAEVIGKLPRVTCTKCSRGQCDEGHRKIRCEDCKSYISERHIHLDYVGHADVTIRLIDVDPEWTWEPQATDPDPEILKAAMASGNPEIVRMVIANAPPKFERDRNGSPVGLWINLTVGGSVKPGVGSCPANQNDAEKVLIGDALRNAAMRFGVAVDLWAKGDRADPSAENATASAGRAVRGARQQGQRPNGQQPKMPRPDQNARPLSPEDPWAAKVDGVTSIDDAADIEAELKQLFEESGISAGHAAQVKAALDAKVAAIRIPPNQRARSSQPQENGGGGDEAAFTRDFMSRLARADADRDFVGMRTELARAVSSRKIAPETANELIEKLNERKAKAAV